MADRVAVLYRGRLSELGMRSGELTAEIVTRLLTGAARSELRGEPAGGDRILRTGRHPGSCRGLAAAATLYFLAAAEDPAAAFRAFFLSPFARPAVLANLIEQAAAPCLCALGTALVFRSGDFNLGGEGRPTQEDLRPSLPC
ncbi:MAG: hypothetical protein MZV70_35715 [Desulfobacterales bacterium]|nr:hypothetical protein [Desulfobacterales bacterium]